MSKKKRKKPQGCFVCNSPFGADAVYITHPDPKSATGLQSALFCSVQCAHEGGFPWVSGKGKSMGNDIMEQQRRFPVKSKSEPPEPTFYRCQCGRPCLVSFRYCPDCGKPKICDG